MPEDGPTCGLKHARVINKTNINNSVGLFVIVLLMGRIAQIRINSGNACYNSVLNLQSSHLLPKNVNTKIQKSIILLVDLHGCET
jgi:hypothetical protein